MTATPPWVRASRALLLGNIAIGCGVMAVAGSLNDLAHSLAVTPAVAGQLITAGAVAMGCGAPLLAALLSRFDRRLLLAGSLLWFAAGHLLAALMPNLALLLPLRALSVLGAALFTPQAAAAIGVLAPPERRGQAITTVFLGWSVASVLGMPMASFVAETWGWRWTFTLVALLALGSAWVVWRSVPAGLRPQVLSWRDWRSALSHPVLMAIVAVTALNGAGQFTLFSYFAPYYRQVLGATPTQVSLLFFWFGVFGLVGSVLMTRWIDRLGAARCVNLALGLMATSMALWPLTGPAGGAALLGGAAGMTAVLVPWALGCFSCNSAQQALLSQSAPALAGALLALNTTAIYAGQAVGAAGGGLLLSAGGYGALAPAALSWTLLGLAVSLWAARRLKQNHAV